MIRMRLATVLAEQKGIVGRRAGKTQGWLIAASPQLTTTLLDLIVIIVLRTRKSFQSTHARGKKGKS